MSEEKTIQLDQVEDIDDADYTTVPGWGGQNVLLGSCTAADILQWMKENNDEVKRETAGLRLLIKCLAQTNADGKHTRIPEDQREAWVERLLAKNPRVNGRLIAAALKLNGMDKSAEKVEEALKNVSGEVVTAASPSVSAAPTGA